MIIMKFGGTSLGDAEKIRNVYSIVNERIEDKPLVVVSAVGGVTDLLLEAVENAGKGIVDFDKIHNKHYRIIEELGLEESSFDHDFDDMKRILFGISYLKEVSPRVEDMFVSYGERLSSRIVARYFAKEGLAARMCPAYDYGMLTDSTFGMASVLKETYSAIQAKLKDVDEVPIVTGFIGKNADGDITTLGRGGSDYTAAIYGAALNASEIQIWTDVTGVMTADPSVINQAASIPHLSFNEAGELAYYGARVLHPSTILPAMKKGIKVRVLNTFAPESEGTLITDHSASGEKQTGVKSVAYKENQILVNIETPRMFMAVGFLSHIANVFESHKAVIDMVSTSETSVSMTVSSEQDMDPLIKDLEQFGTVSVDYGKCILCVVGEGIPDIGGIASRMIGSLEKAEIRLEMISQAQIGINISVLINDEDIDKAVKTLHAEFFE